MKKKPAGILAVAAAALLAGFFCLPASFDKAPTSTVLESAEGRLLGARIAADGQWRFPGSDTLSAKYAQCVVTFEDKRFYYHFGVDPLAVLRALWQNIRQGRVVEGGSTITMQCVRLMRRGKSRTLWEKMVEAVLAVRMECRYSKQSILRLYAQHAPFGGNVVGIEAAAWRYYGRSPHDLSWAEAATLAVLPNAPALIHPGRNRARLLQKRNALLQVLCTAGCFPAADLPLAQAEPLPGKPLPLPDEAPHLLERLAQTHEGTALRTTVQYHLQQRAAGVVNRHAARLRGNHVRNLAAIIIENNTGRVLAYVGNATGWSDTHEGDRVDIIAAPRSTGSILKPFLFAALLDEGTILPNTLLPDIPTYINGFVPQNYARTFDGAVPAHRALERSLNIPAVLLLQEYGVPRFHTLLREMNFSTITRPPDHYGLSLILGGAEATLWDAANAYAAMARTVSRFTANGGAYRQSDRAAPSVLLPASRKEEAEVKEGKTLLSAAACWQILQSLSEVGRPEGEEGWERFPSSRRVAWKTGTSFGNRDAWAVGTTPEYTIGVWAGNATGEGRPMLTGTQAAAPVLFDLFNLLPPTGWFAPPLDELYHIAVCRESGHRATALCPAVDSMWVTAKGLESTPCPYHIPVHLDRTGTFRVTSDCEQPHRMIVRPWFVLPPAQEYFYKLKYPSYRPLPPMHPGCLQSLPGQSMTLLYPQQGFRIVLTKQADGTPGRLIMQAAHRRAGAVIHWHLDTEYLGSTQPPHQMPALPAAGQHTLTLVDEQGASVRCTFRVE